MFHKFTLFFVFALLGARLGMAQISFRPVIDAHVHIKTTPEDYPKTIEEYLEENKSYDLKYVFGLTVTFAGQHAATTARNDSLFSIASRYPKFIPVCSVHPYDGEFALQELDRIAGAGGKIVKLHPISQNFEILDQRVDKFVKEAGKRNLIVLIDGYGFATPDYLDNLLHLSLMNRGTRFIIAHMGGPDFHKLGALWMVRRTNPGMFGNVWYDLSATVVMFADSPYQAQLEWVIQKLGTDRILFASDDPTASLGESLEKFDRLNLTDEEKERILYKNAMELVGLE